MSFTVGDSRPLLTGQVTSNGYGVNLSGSVLQLHIKRPSGTVLTVGANPVGVDGRWSSQWGSDDLDEAGSWTVELQVAYPDGGVQTFGPVSFTVRAQIA